MAAGPVMRQAAATARPHPLSPFLSYEEMIGAMRNALEQVFAEGQDPGEALAGAQRSLTRRAAPPEPSDP